MRREGLCNGVLDQSPALCGRHDLRRTGTTSLSPGISEDPPPALRLAALFHCWETEEAVLFVLNRSLYIKDR
jgi:hypothetical protein